ncbi:hypothetical protein BDV33DRAFT_162472 [Aspergillus novoparasiticus]|uniref:Cora-like Mg2+ transporter protein-domain-containing protein n=1 Tax=Aspergillus novoparasiticus TaxID=986946 RepID=A0A5N6FCL7_9EURO|nr:hypothetical protein BDV33DRAFT_162472 [Aspergillus novoparasiticus]
MELSSVDTPQPPEVTIFEDDGTDQWRQEEEVSLEQYLSSPQRCSTQVVFLKQETLKQCATLLNLPSDFQRTLKDDLNGSSHTEYGFNGNEISQHKSWTVFKLKKVNTADKYYWMQPSVFVEWNIPPQQTPTDSRNSGRGTQPATNSNNAPGVQRVFFVNLPLDEQRSIQKNFPSRYLRYYNPYIWHAVFAREVAMLYDKCFWSLRHLVRDIEKKRNTSTLAELQATDFPNLHDIARHIFHSTEILEVAEHTINSVVTEQSRWREEFMDIASKARGAHLQTGQKLAFAAKEMHSLKIRSKSLTDRLDNEINLAFNLVNQGFGRNAQSDSAMMKTIGVVSLVYLPGTFVSGIFGTNFFDYQSGAAESWEMAKNFWLYWAVTLPLTLATVVVWALWHYRLTLKKGYWKGKSKVKGKDEDPMDKV